MRGRFTAFYGPVTLKMNININSPPEDPYVIFNEIQHALGLHQLRKLLANRLDFISLGATDSADHGSMQWKEFTCFIWSTIEDAHGDVDSWPARK